MIHKSARSTHENSQDLQAIENKDPTYWMIMNTGLWHHVKRFAALESTLKEIEQPSVLEIAGTGNVLNDIYDQYGGHHHLSVSLADHLSETRRLLCTSKGIEHLNGDLNEAETWEKIRNHWDNFDVIMVKPEGGWKFFTRTYKATFIALNNIINLLNNNGTAFIQLPYYRLDSYKLTDLNFLEKFLKPTLKLNSIECEVFSEKETLDTKKIVVGTYIVIKKVNDTTLDPELFGNELVKFLQSRKLKNES